MKKVLTISLLFIFAGCSWFGGGSDDSSSSQNNYPYYTEVQGYVATENWKPGVLYTHAINDITGDLIIGAKSTEVNLTKYDGAEVLAKGQVSLASDNKTEVLLVESIDAIQSPSKMRTFSTGSLDFSFQYPDSLTVRKLVSGVKLNDVDDNTVFHITEEKKSSDDLMTIVNAIAPTGQKILETNLNIEGQEAVRRVEELNDVRFTTVFILGRENFYTLKFLNPDSAQEEKWEAAFDDLITSFSANDLGAIPGVGEICGGTMEIACQGSLVCLLDGDYSGAEGVCITEDTYTQDSELLREGCNNTEGFISEKEVNCDYASCVVMPTCTCSGSRVWDQIEGCISADQVGEVSEGEPTAVEDLTFDEDTPEEDTPEEDTPTDTEDEITPSSQISGETRTMESSPWKFALEYPKNWYYMSLGGGKYAFAPDEDPELNSAVTVSVVDKCSSSTGVICTEVGSKTFEISYQTAYSAQASAMSSSISLTE